MFDKQLFDLIIKTYNQDVANGVTSTYITEKDKQKLEKEVKRHLKVLVR